MVLDLLNAGFTVMTAWSLGIMFIHYRRWDYEKYFPLMIWLQWLCVNVWSGTSFWMSLVGLVVCFWTIHSTYDPYIRQGQKLVQF